MINKLLFAALLFTAGCLQAQEAVVTTEAALRPVVEFPSRTGLVNDFENIFSAQQSKELNKVLTDYEAKTGRKIVVASLTSIAPYERFDEYARELSDNWQVGSADKSDGLSIIFSKSLRQIRVSTGYGDDQTLTNETCKKVIDDVIIPQFKKGDFYEGVKLGVVELINLWQ